MISIGPVGPIATAYSETVKLWRTMLEGATPETRERIMRVIATQMEWWQEYIWGPLGEEIAAEIRNAREGDDEGPAPDPFD